MSANAYIMVIALAITAGHILFLLCLFRAYCLPKLDFIAGNEVSANTVAVVIAARNEAENIETTLRCILEQDGVASVTLIDDHSSDGTYEKAYDIVRSNTRLRVLHAPQLPEGWVGKTSAMEYGSKGLGDRYILFTDADVLISPGTVRQAAAFMDRHELDHLSGCFKILGDSLAQSICAPLMAAGCLVSLFVSCKTKGAGTGAFTMVRTTAYCRNGGHTKIKGSIVDDIALAQMMVSHGGKSGFLDLSDRVSVCFLQGFCGLMDIARRGTVAFLGKRRLLALLISLFLIFVPVSISFLLVLCWFPLCVSVCSVLHNGWMLAAVMVSPYVSGFACFISCRRYYSTRIIGAALYPVAEVVMAWGIAMATVSSVLGRPIRWRGREYSA